MTADIQTILQLLQKQTTVVPPAYSMVTAGAEYQRPIIHLMKTSHPLASIKTDRSFSPSSQVSIDSVQPRGFLKVWFQGPPESEPPGVLGKVQILIPISVSTQLEFLGIGPVICILNKPPDSYAHLMFENNGPGRMTLKH